MNRSNFRITLDIHDSNSQAILYVKKGDTARKILVTLSESGRLYRITEDCTAVFTAKKPDGKIVFNSCRILGDMIEYEVSKQTTAAEGEVTCEMRLYGENSALITSPRFTIIVDDTLYKDGDVIESADEFSALTELISRTSDLKKDIETALANGAFQGAQGPAGKDAEVDATLKLAGAAADAEVVGRKFEELKNGKGRVSVAEAASQLFVVKDSLNGVYFMCETRDAAEPSVAFYGDSGDESVLLQNVAEPKTENDASNKGYVDETFSKAPRVFRAGDDLTYAKDGDFLLDDEEDEDEPEVDDDAFVTVEEMKKHVAEAISSALGEIGFAEGVEY